MPAGFVGNFIPVLLNSALTAGPICKPFSGGISVQNIPHGPVYPAGFAGYITLARMKSVLRFVGIYCVLSAALGAVALVSSFPARPSSWLGLFVLVVPITLVGEVVAESLHRNRIARAIERRTQSKRFSWLRLGYLLSLGLVVAAAVVSINLAFSPAG